MKWAKRADREQGYLSGAPPFLQIWARTHVWFAFTWVHLDVYFSTAITSWWSGEHVRTPLHATCCSCPFLSRFCFLTLLILLIGFLIAYLTVKFSLGFECLVLPSLQQCNRLSINTFFLNTFQKCVLTWSSCSVTIPAIFKYFLTLLAIFSYIYILNHSQTLTCLENIFF